MKTKWKLFFGVLALSIFFVACDKSNSDEAIANVDEAITEEPVADAIEMGTVSLNPSLKDVDKITTGKGLDLATILDVTFVTLVDSNNERLSLGRYRNLSEFIELPVGNYRINLFVSTNSAPNFDSPGYSSGWDDIEVTTGTKTTVSPIMYLNHVAVTIDFSDSILENYPDISVEAYDPNPFDASPETQKLVWTSNEDGLVGYLHFGSFVVADLLIQIKATDPLTGSEISISKTYVDAKHNQHYHINIVKSDSSTISIDPSLGEEEVTNDTIPFPN